MPSRRLILCAVLAAVTLAGSAAAQASPRVVSAYAYFAPNPDRYTRGLVWVAVRTDRALTDEQASAVGYTISRREHCYGLYVAVGKHERIPSSYRLRLGRHGSIADARLPVLRVRPGYGQGGLIGCTRDPAARVYVTNLSPQPLVKPAALFFAADNGPRVVDLRWYGWGTARAVGYGAALGAAPGTQPDEVLDVRPARIIYTRPRMCPGYGALSYTMFEEITWDRSYRRHVERHRFAC